MSIVPVVEAIEEFLASKTPETLCIHGEWGVGKTHHWETAYKKAAGAKAIGLDRYVYVSLFGLQSLAEVKVKLYEETVPTSVTDPEKAPGVIADNLGKVGALVRKNAKDVVGTTAALLKVAPAAAAFDRIAFAMVEKQIVCIDDLERKGAGLPLNDILGLASFLRLERRCKVVVLMNSDQLGTETDTFLKRSEKAFDRTLELKPTDREAAEAGIGESHKHHQMLRDRVVQLKVTNIRLIHRIVDFVDRAEAIAPDAPEPVARDIRQSISLFVPAAFEKETFPPPAFLRRFSRAGFDRRPRGARRSSDPGQTPEQKEKDEQEHKWGGILLDWGFEELTPLDGILLDGVERGYFDAEKLKSEVARLAVRRSTTSRLQAFWQRYDDALVNSPEAVLDELQEIAASEVDRLSPPHADRVVTFLRAFGRSAEASRLIGDYVAARQEDLAFSESGNFFTTRPMDPELKKAITDAIAAFDDRRDPQEVLARVISSTQNNSTQDLRLLAKQPASFYEKFLRESQGEQLARALGVLRDIDRSALSQKYPPLDGFAQAIDNLSKANAMNAAKLEDYVRPPVDDAFGGQLGGSE